MPLRCIANVGLTKSQQAYSECQALKRCKIPFHLRMLFSSKDSNKARLNRQALLLSKKSQNPTQQLLLPHKCPNLYLSLLKPLLMNQLRPNNHFHPLKYLNNNNNSPQPYSACKNSKKRPRRTAGRPVIRPPSTRLTRKVPLSLLRKRKTTLTSLLSHSRVYSHQQKIRMLLIHHWLHLQ